MTKATWPARQAIESCPPDMKFLSKFNVKITALTRLELPKPVSQIWVVVIIFGSDLGRTVPKLTQSIAIPITSYISNA